jgi:hypothetical protein
MFSTFPKLIDKAFIVGYLLPVLIFVIFATAIYPTLPILSGLIALSDQDKRQSGSIAYLAISMFGLSTVMVILNNMLYKIVEGYIWPIPQFAE